MDRWFARCGIVVLTMVLAAGCTREPEKTTVAATPVAIVAATPQGAAAKPPAAAEPVEELYVDLEAEPDEGEPPLSVTFTTSVEDGVPPLTYTWDFGDSSPPGTGASPTHVYQKEGEYTAVVTVKDSKGISGSEEVDILVEEEE